VFATALLGVIGLTFSTPLIVVAMSTITALRRVRDEDALVGRSVPARSSSRPSLA
jgi:predicted PurR-regulated permease PerM